LSPPLLPQPTHPTPIPSPLSLHDALPIYRQRQARKCPLKISVHFRPAPVPPGRGGQGLGLLFEVDHHGRGIADIPAAARVSYLLDRKSTRLNSSHVAISYAVFCLKKKKVN